MGSISHGCARIHIYIYYCYVIAMMMIYHDFCYSYIDILHIIFHDDDHDDDDDDDDDDCHYCFKNSIIYIIIVIIINVITHNASG